MTIKDSHVVVTGGGSGSGAAIAHSFAKAGARVTILGRSEAPLQAQGLPYQMCDVTDAGQVNTAFDHARAHQGPISVVIANAGAAPSKPFAKMDTADFNAALAVNLTGVFNSFHAALPDMVANGGGRMIAIASTAGLKGYGYVSGYCAAKHGVIGLVKSLALELATKNITVNAICPGFMETPMLEASIRNIMDKTGMAEDQAQKALYKDNPQQRFIQVDEVADTALYLCSDAARSVNGHALTIAGGEV